MTINTLDGGASIQELINAKLREMYNPEMFIEKEIIKPVKNTTDITCRTCGSDNINVESKQLRSADEATTLLFLCLNCGAKWKLN